MNLRYENKLVLVFTFAAGIAGVDVFALNFLAPFVVSDLRINNTKLGLIGALSLLSWAASALAGARLSDRLARRKVFLVGAFMLFAVASAASGLSHSYGQLLAARLSVGLAMGPVIPIMQSILMIESSDNRRGFNMGVAQHFGAQLIGAVFSPVLLVWIAANTNWRAAFFVAAIPSLVVAALIGRCVHEPATATSGDVSAKSLAAAAAEVLKRPNLRLCLLIGACSIAWYSLFLTFVPLWTIRERGLSTQAMSFVMSSMGAAGAISALVVSLISDRLGRRPAIVAFAVLGASGPAALLLSRGAVEIGVIVFVTSFFSGTFALFLAVVPMESAMKTHSAMIPAVVLSAAQFLGFVGPFVGGFLADTHSLNAPLVLMIFLACCASLAGCFLSETAPRRARRASR